MMTQPSDKGSRRNSDIVLWLLAPGPPRADPLSNHRPDRGGPAGAASKIFNHPPYPRPLLPSTPTLELPKVSDTLSD